MRKYFLILVIVIVTFLQSKAQTYFPPLIGSTWESVSPASLGWNVNRVDSLYQFLDDNHSKSFIILKDGKIVIEKYFGTFTKDSFWYWASASKSLAAVLTGIAQQENKLSINDSVSNYLGLGWTDCPAEKEGLIKIKNLLSMTSGLDDGIAPTPSIPDPDNCMADSCLQYLTDAGTRWAYHNAPYRLIQDVVANATGMTFQQYCNTKVNAKIGTFGLWIDYIFYSKARDMARFGLLIQNKGIWNNDTVLKDSLYFHAMTNSSQSINPSYGYLWWLNGKGKHMLPQSQLVFQTDIIPNAPDDLIAALGKNDQKIHVVPSKGLVIIRQGDASGLSLYALSSFDNELWEQLNLLFPSTAIQTIAQSNVQLFYPNPSNGNIQFAEQVDYVEIYDMLNKKIIAQNVDKNLTFQTEPGIYRLLMHQKGQIIGNQLIMIQSVR